jgi:hypothetical protein
MRPIRLTIKESDDSIHELIIEDRGGGIDVRQADAPEMDADRLIAITIGNEHCPVCLKQPDEDCETNGQTLVLSVELADA